MRFLTDNQKQQRANVCEEVRQIASDDATLSRVIMVMTLTKSSNPPNGK
jgi:hypothetical protein